MSLTLKGFLFIQNGQKRKLSIGSAALICRTNLFWLIDAMNLFYDFLAKIMAIDVFLFELQYSFSDPKMANTGLGKMHLDLYTQNAGLTHKAKFWCNYVSALKGKTISTKLKSYLTRSNAWTWPFTPFCTLFLALFHLSGILRKWYAGDIPEKVNTLPLGRDHCKENLFQSH